MESFQFLSFRVILRIKIALFKQVHTLTIDRQITVFYDKGSHLHNHSHVFKTCESWVGCPGKGATFYGCSLSQTQTTLSCPLSVCVSCN